MFARNSSVIVLLTLLSVASFTPVKARVQGGGDPSGCYTSRADFDTSFCQKVHISNIKRVYDHEVNGYTCRKNQRDWICKGEATIVIPHEGRLEK